MPSTSKIWQSLESWRSTAFRVAGVVFLVNAALIVAAITTDNVQLMQEVGQIFVGLGWTAAFVGLLGVYPSLADRSRWLSRLGVVLATVGLVVFAVMAVMVAAYTSGVLAGDFATLVPVFLPGVVLGSVLGFVTFGVACLRSEVHSRAFGLLLFVPALTVVANIALGATGNGTPVSVLGIVLVLVVSHSAIGSLLRRGDAITVPMDGSRARDPSSG